MKKWISLLFVLAFVAVYSDQVTFSWIPQNTDTITGARYKSDRNAMANPVNGNLDNNNFKAGANIAQSKIDSATGWLIERVGRFINGTGFRELHSEKGWKIFANDTTSYDKEILLISDSTDTMMVLSNDSSYITKPVHMKDSVFVKGIMRVNDTIISKKAIHAYKYIKADSIRIDSNLTISKTVISDSLNVAKGIKAETGYFDSIKVGANGFWLKNSIWGKGKFYSKIFGSVGDTIMRDSCAWVMFDSTVALSVPVDTTRIGVAESFNTTYYVSGMPDAIRPKALVTINYPVLGQYMSNRDFTSGEASAEFKIPSVSASLCTLKLRLFSDAFSTNISTIKPGKLSYEMR